MSNISPDFPLLCGLYIFSGGAQFVVALFLLTVVQPQQQESPLPPHQKKDVRALAYGFLVAGLVIFLLFALLLLYGKAFSTFTLAILLLSVLLVMVPIQVVLGFLTLQRKSEPAVEVVVNPGQVEAELIPPLAANLETNIGLEPNTGVLTEANLVVHNPNTIQDWTAYLDRSLLAEMAEAAIVEEPTIIMNEAIRLWLRRRALSQSEISQGLSLRNEHQARYWQRYQGND